jgi:hypothetical protein
MSQRHPPTPLSTGNKDVAVKPSQGFAPLRENSSRLIRSSLPLWTLANV